MIKVLICDDHQLFAEGLAQALDSQPDLKVVGVAGDGSQVREHLGEPVDVLLMDLEMPGKGGLETLGELDRRLPVIIVSMHSGPEQVEAAREAGAVGFFSKAAPLAELAAAVRAAAAGERLIALEEAERRQALQRYAQAPLDPGAAALTEREREILQLLAQGVSGTDELADRLYISHKTVKNHLASIFSKLAVSDRTQAAIEAIRLGLARPK